MSLSSWILSLRDATIALFMPGATWSCSSHVLIGPVFLFLLSDFLIKDAVAELMSDIILEENSFPELLRKQVFKAISYKTNRTDAHS